MGEEVDWTESQEFQPIRVIEQSPAQMWGSISLSASLTDTLFSYQRAVFLETLDKCSGLE